MTPQSTGWLNTAVEAIEHSTTATRIGSSLERLLSPLRRVPGGRRALSGTDVGHPLHPMLVTAPIGAWLSASLLDLTRRDPRAARTLVGAGVLLALPTALTGASDWLDTEGAERRVGTVHACVGFAATSLYVASFIARPRRPGLGVAFAVAGSGAVAAAGWIGGHLAHSLGVGVDTNAFVAGPTEWTDLGVVPTREGANLAVVDGVRLVATRIDGAVRVLADRCSHRGGPLSEGEVVDGCVSCPWHGSRFDAVSGRVRKGPASIPQPTYDVREEAEGIDVRRVEERRLRTNPV